MSLRVLITGGTGLLGRNLIETAPPVAQLLATQHRLAPPPERAHLFRPLDLADGGQMQALFQEFSPDWVIHTASVGNVDEAQTDPGGVRRINVEATARLGEVCLRHKSRMAFISSNAVFDGTRPPYREGDPVCPVNRYGELKVEAEAWIQRWIPSALIIRPILMYGWPFPGGRQNVLTRWLAALERGGPVEAADDIISMPLSGANCAQAIWAAVSQGRKGIYHVAGKDRISLDRFAHQVARSFGFSPDLVRSVPNSRLHLLAPRPRDTSFVTRKMEQELGVQPVGILEGLQALQRTSCISS